MTTHYLKCYPRYFEAVEEAELVFQLRRADRLYQRGDYVVLQKFQPGSDLYVMAEADETGTDLTKDADKADWIGPFMIGTVLHGPELGLSIGWCAFSLLATAEMESQVEMEPQVTAEAEENEVTSKPH